MCVKISTGFVFFDTEYGGESQFLLHRSENLANGDKLLWKFVDPEVRSRTSISLQRVRGGHAILHALDCAHMDHQHKHVEKSFFYSPNAF
jgi:hypothetical protein